MNNKTINIDNLKLLVDKYFDGLTTTEEERQLREGLASSEVSSTELDEARAALGVFAAARAAKRASRRRRFNAIPRIAATAACACLLLGATIWFSRSYVASASFAVIGDERIDDMDQIRSLMRSDLQSIADARSSVDAAIEAELSALSEALNSETF